LNSAVVVKFDFLAVWEHALVGVGSENHCTIDIGNRHRGSPDSVGVAVATARPTNADRLVRVCDQDNSHHRAPTSTNRFVIREHEAAFQESRFGKEYLKERETLCIYAQRSIVVAVNGLADHR
jgi:hypothetical protein